MRKAGVPFPTAVESFCKTKATEISILEELKVGEIMTKKVITVPPTMTANELLDEIAEHHHIGFPIMDESKQIVGIVTLQDAMKVAKEKRSSVSVGEIGTKGLVVVFPDNSVAEAFEKMSKHNVGRLLVVDKKDSRLLVGILTRSDLMHTLSNRTKLTVDI